MADWADAHISWALAVNEDHDMGDQFHSELVPLQGFGNVDAVPQQLEYNLTGRPAFAIVNVFLRGQQRVLASAGQNPTLVYRMYITRSARRKDAVDGQ